MEVVSGIHQIKVPFPKELSGYTNVYVLEGEEGSILIDAGWDAPESLWALREGLKAGRLRLQDIKNIVITHVHPDHYGLASKVKQLTGARVAMHKIEAESIKPRYKDSDKLLKEMEKLLQRNGVPQAELSEMKDASLWMKKFVTPELPEVMLDDGDSISNGTFEIRVMRTPGHSPGHICLHELRKKVFFSGDHILYDMASHIGFNPLSGENPLAEYNSSLEKLDRLEVTFVLPGHGPVFNSLRLRMANIINQHEQKQRKIIRVMNDGLKTAYQIAENIACVTNGGATTFRDLSPWDRRLAVMEVIAYLQLLSSEGKVGEVTMDGVSLYLAKD